MFVQCVYGVCVVTVCGGAVAMCGSLWRCVAVCGGVSGCLVVVVAFPVEVCNGELDLVRDACGVLWLCVHLKLEIISLRYLGAFVACIPEVLFVVVCVYGD